MLSFFCAGSSLLPVGFPSTVCCQFVHGLPCSGFSYCRAQSSMVVACGLHGGGMGLVALQYVGSFQTRDVTGVPCIARRILNHWTTS